MGTSGDCTATATCLVPNGFLSTSPSLAGSGIFLAAFAILIPANFFTGMRHHTPLYSSTIIAGLLFEVVGYVGRMLLSFNVASVASFALYMTGTIMGPAFITSAIYQIIPHVIVLYGDQFKLVSQPAYVRVFSFSFDLATLAFQAAGIALAVSGQEEMALGMDLLQVGLILQMASTLAFFTFHWYFIHSLNHRRYILDPTYQEVYLSAKFKFFLLCTQVATFLIGARTVARLVSLQGGFDNHLNQSQLYTLLLDGALVLVACIILTTFPAGGALGYSWRLTSPSFTQDHNGSLSLHQRFGRRSGYRRPANISLPLPPQLPLAHSPGSPPYHPLGAPSPPFPTPPLYSYSPGSPPYRPGGAPPGPPPRPPPHPQAEGSPGFTRQPHEFAPGYGGVMSPGFAPGHRRGQASRTLVNSDQLW